MVDYRRRRGYFNRLLLASNMRSMAGKRSVENDLDISLWCSIDACLAQSVGAEGCKMARIGWQPGLEKMRDSMGRCSECRVSQ